MKLVVGMCENCRKIDWKKVFAIAEKNTKYNSQGQSVIIKDDEWRHENEWDEYSDEDISLDHPRNH